MTLKFYTYFRTISMILILSSFLSTVAWGKVIYVSPIAAGYVDGTSWSNAYDNLQTAIHNAMEGDSLWVQEGTYIPKNILTPGSSSNINKFFGLNKNIKIFGGFKGNETDFSQRDWINNPTILSGDHNSNNNNLTNYTSITNRSDDSRRVFVAIGDLQDAELDGFYIKYAYNSNTTFNQTYNGVSLINSVFGILIQNCTGLTLKNLDISWLYSTNKSGFNIINSVVQLDNIRISKVYGLNSNNNFEHSKISGKNLFIDSVQTKNYGSGLSFFTDKKSTIENLSITNTITSSWGALDIYLSDTVNINRLILSNNNSGATSALSIDKSKVKISNALIFNNFTSNVNNAITISDGTTEGTKSYLKLTNVTITKNISTNSNSRKYIIGGTNRNVVDISNSIIFQPSYLLASLTINKSYNNYLSSSSTSTNSNNNIVRIEDPFLDYNNNNFQLQIGSLARNGADSTYLTEHLNVPNLLNIVDVYGNPRVNLAGKLDIGAVEDTLIDALLNKYKLQFNYNLKEQTLQTKIENHPFVQLVIKGGNNASSLRTLQSYNIQHQNQFVEQYKIQISSDIYFELWGKDEQGVETLLSIQTKTGSDPLVNIQLSPNPATNQLKLSLPSVNIQSIQIFDLNGKLIKNIFPVKQSILEINISDLHKGTFYLVVQSDLFKQTIPFIKL